MVWEGVKPGIYESWSECQANIKNYPGARYKSFKTMEEAEKAFYEPQGVHLHSHRPKTSKKPTKRWPQEVLKASIAVDAACSGNPGVMEYRGVYTISGEEIFRQGPFEEGTNNIGEFLALVHALALLKNNGKEDIAIYTDSVTAMAWVRNKKMKTNLSRTAKNKDLWQLVEKAIIWLQNNSYKNKIIKWNTKKWGEIPADFGRK